MLVLDQTFQNSGYYFLVPNSIIVSSMFQLLKLRVQVGWKSHPEYSVTLFFQLGRTVRIVFYQCVLEAQVSSSAGTDFVFSGTYLDQFPVLNKMHMSSQSSLVLGDNDAEQNPQRVELAEQVRYKEEYKFGQKLASGFHHSLHSEEIREQVLSSL